MNTIAEAKEFLKTNHDEGAKCPCCGQLVKKYHYKINYGMAFMLIQMYKSNDWVHPIKQLKAINGDYAKMRFWNLVEKSSEKADEDKKANGYWRITQKGRDFVEGRITIQAKALLFDNRCSGFEGEQVTIKQALGKRFNFGELMKGYEHLVSADGTPAPKKQQELFTDEETK